MDIGKLVEGFLGSRNGGSSSGQGLGQQVGGALKNFPGGLAGGAAAGGLLTLLMGNKKARKLGGKALTYGGMAVVAALAYKAWQNYRSGLPAAPADLQALPAPPADSGFDPMAARDTQGRDLRLALIQAMISAAKADNHIDAAEDARIREQIAGANLAADEKGFLFDLLGQASDPIAVARLARDEPQAAELYLASALAIDIDTPDERRYMERLGDALRLPAPLVTQLNGQAAAARAAAA